MKGIQKVVKEDLCIGCGTCYSACPFGAISLTKTDVFVPSIDAAKCDDCGLCEFSCPGFHVDYERFVPKEDGKTRWNSLIGKYVDVYLGYAKDHYIRFMGSSGGMISAILLYALQNKIIDGALVVSMKGINSQIMIARSTEELKKAMGSKYLPVPLNVGLRKILGMDGNFAVVGLPCHLLGLTRMTLLYPALATKIVLRLGLFCGRGFDYHFVNSVLKRLGVHPTSVQEIRFRGYGWPGKVFVNCTSESGNRELHFDYSKLGSFSGGYLFLPKRCIFCPDHTAELADISFGDAWLKKIKQVDSQGTSLMITRTALGDKILWGAVQDGHVKVSKSSVRDVIRSQYLQLDFHKLSLAARCSVARTLGVKMPLINIENTCERSIFTTFSSFVLIATQTAYRIIKKLGVSEELPKPLVKICGMLHFLLGMTDFKLAIRDKLV